jgi:dTDP-glucose pyrophosphorylase
MKALILAGGRGVRIGDQTTEANKCMLRLMGKPLIQYSLENAEAVGVSQIVIVVGHRAEDIINYFGTSFGRTPVRYVIQSEQRGVVHAISCAERAIDGEDFMLLLADEVISQPAHKEMLTAFREEGLFAACGTVLVEDCSQIRKTYAVLGDHATGRIYRLVEKPRKPVNNIMGTGNCILRAAIYEYVERTPLNVERGQKELPDLIQCAVDEGNTVRHFNIGNGYININTPDDIEIAERVYETRLVAQ